MARQIAHEIKNPLTPMKLNIQFMLRSLQMEDTEKFKERFRAVSGMLIEQIDNMAAIASAFSDFAKMSEAHNETFEVDELVRNCSLLFKNNTEELECEGRDPDIGRQGTDEAGVDQSVEKRRTEYPRRPAGSYQDHSP